MIIGELKRRMRTIIQAHLLLPVTHFHIFADIYFHSSKKIDNAKVLLKSCVIDLGQQRKYRFYFTSFGWINISLDIRILKFIQIAQNELNISRRKWLRMFHTKFLVLFIEIVMFLRKFVMFEIDILIEFDVLYVCLDALTMFLLVVRDNGATSHSV